MADLSNSKIKDTYQFLLQADGSGNLQTGLGANPNPIIIRGNLTYIDGNQRSGYVLKSDADGKATWGDASVGDLYISAATLDNTILKLETTSGSTILVPVSYWSSDGLGNYANSGLTGNIGIGIETPNEKLTVLGAISATTDLYLGCEAYEDSTITAQEKLTIKGRGTDNDFMVLKQDKILVYLDGLEAASFISTSTGATSNIGQFSFNSSAQDYDFKITGEDHLLFHASGSKHAIRVRNHLTIGPSTVVPWNDGITNWGLAVTGSSLFYSGGTAGTNKNAIDAYGEITTSGNINILNNNSLLTAKISTTGGTVSESLTIQAGSLYMQNEEGSREYYSILSNLHQFYLNDNVVVTYDGEGGNQGLHFTTHSGGEYYNFIISGKDSTRMYETDSANLVNRFRHHVGIGNASGIPANIIGTYGLALTGSSLFYSGGTNAANYNAIEAEGNMTIAGDINILNNNSLLTAKISTTGGTQGESLTIEAGTTHIRNEDGLTEYLKLTTNGITFYVNDTEGVIYSTTAQKYLFDGRPGSATDWYTFNFAGDNGYDVFAIDPQWERVSIKDHVSIGATHAVWPNMSAINYGLFVSGSSRFYSGGTTGVNINAIESRGNITLSGNMVATGDVISSGLTTTIGTITSGTTDLNDLFVKTSDLEYYLGTVTSVAISGGDGIEIDSGSPITNSGTIKLGLSGVDTTKIADGTVTDTEFQYINTLSSNAQTQLTNKLDLEGGTMDGPIEMATNKITGLLDPTAAQDAATKAYADSLDHNNYWSGETGNTLFPISPTNTKLGIGTSTPANALEVVGAISATTNITASGSIRGKEIHI